MTNHWVDIRNADVVMVMGGNPAEAHPCGFKWVVEAKAHRKAKLIVVDPRYTRTAAVAMAVSMPEPFMIPVNAPAASRMAAIITAALACASTRARCADASG